MDFGFYDDLRPIESMGEEETQVVGDMITALCLAQSNDKFKAKSSADRVRLLRQRRKVEREQQLRQTKTQDKSFGESGETVRPKTSAERVRLLRQRRKVEPQSQQQTEEATQSKTSTDRVRVLRQKRRAQRLQEMETHLQKRKRVEGRYLERIKTVCELSADREFQRLFDQNKFGVSCDVCDRLWFQKDIQSCPEAGKEILGITEKPIEEYQVCNTCYAALRRGKLPTMSTANGFVYPPIPKHLPPLDAVTERLVSPRLPFMQIRRLRSVFGAKGLVGQVVNVPVDVDQMVSCLPRMLDDDCAFNVNIKRHQIHKSSYIGGYITKAAVKKWLEFLLQTELYKMYKIKVNKDFFKPFKLPVADEDHLTDEEKKLPLVEELNESENDANEFLLAKQHTLMWSEEKYLDIAPSMKQVPLGLLFDEHAEELSFPSIYLGKARKFKINVTPYMMAASEIRRTDRRGVKPEHVLYMASKVMRFRIRDNIGHSFVASDGMKSITRKDIEDNKFIDNCLEQNLAFLKTIPNSAQYWVARKRDVFAMIRQLGKPTLFLTMSASEYSWNDLLRLLYRLKFGKEFSSEEEPVDVLSADLRTTLVNDDPVACCLYFDKLVDTIMHLLKSSKYSPFGEYRVVDYFKRIEFQQRGSPHAHILLWLENDPREPISESMPQTVKLVDYLCSVDQSQIENPKLQTHKHTFTCYKKVVVDEMNKQCRFGAPFWPVKTTVVLLPIPVTDKRREMLRCKYRKMHQSLEFEDFESTDEFLQKHNVNYEQYLNVLRAGITRPRIFVRRTVQQKFINNFNPWIAEKLMSNMDIQFILEEFSCATYVVEYVNKSNRGLSNLHRELIKLRDEYPEKDYSELLKCLGTQILNAVEISSQEAAWYLLGLHMSESSRKVEYIPTVWPHERFLVRKTKEEMAEDNVTEDSTNVWRDTLIDKYQKRPKELNNVTLANFTARWYKGANNQFQLRKTEKIIRYRGYSLTDIQNYKREMVLLHVPFRDEQKEILEDDRYLQLYEENESQILEQRKIFESELDIDTVMQECKNLMIEEKETVIELKDESGTPIIKQVNDDFVQSVKEGINEDIIMQNVERLPGVVRRRENVMTSEEFRAAMRGANALQLKLLLDVIYRMYTQHSEPLQIFLTGPAGCGKTWLVKLLMEIYNRFSQQHNIIHNAYIASASTGMAAAAINGATVHSIFKICNSARVQTLSVESLHLFRSLMRNIRAVFVDECSMIGSGILNTINTRLQHILQQYEKPFGGMDMIFTGDLRQLPPVCQSPIYKRSRQNFCAEIVWQTLKYYPLEQVMRQSDVMFSSILTKIGDGLQLTAEERKIIESRFVTKEEAAKLAPDSIRLFFNTADVATYNLSVIQGEDVLEFVAHDCYSGTTTPEQLKNARAKVHKMKPDETGGLPYILRLQLNRPYMVRSNVDVIDGIVNGVIGWLRYVECDPEDKTMVKRLWFDFENKRVGRLLRAKTKGMKATNKELQESWVPILKRSATIQLKSKIITCKRTQFPVVEACAITIHKSQGGTYQKVVYDYKKSHDQQLVYVALSRATSLDGLFLTNSENDFNFYHAKGRINQELRNEFYRLQRNRLKTIVDEVAEFTEEATITLCTFNVQSITAHAIDLEADDIISSCSLLLLNETWIENQNRFNISAFRLVNHFKRKDIRAGGVAIYENTKTAKEMASKPYELYKYEEQQIKQVETKHNDVGDICTARVMIDGRETLVIAIYISPNATTNEIHKFLTFNLMAYSPKLKGLFDFCDEEKLYDIPIIVGGDFNTTLEATDKFGNNITDFMKKNFDLDLTNNPNVGTTKAGTCIDGVFSRYVPNIKTRDYISYFSYHKPLVSSITFTEMEA